MCSSDLAKIIFNNVAGHALLSDCLTERLEDPLGLIFEGGTGDDCIGSRLGRAHGRVP